jgi:hypothetical protein
LRAARAKSNTFVSFVSSWFKTFLLVAVPWVNAS